MPTNFNLQHFLHPQQNTHRWEDYGDVYNITRGNNRVEADGVDDEEHEVSPRTPNVQDPPSDVQDPPQDVQESVPDVQDPVPDVQDPVEVVMDDVHDI
ncbi:unnamed protein product [Cochlearia groenlandica]